MRKLVFGPVPSRRLGMSLGLNTIPYQKCSYSCVYCQLGATRNLRVHRENFYDPQALTDQVREKLGKLTDGKEPVDYLTVVTDGEPTLDRRLGETIDALKPFGIPIAVWTNGSLLSREDIRKDLMAAHLVSVKIDAISEEIWKRINRPHSTLDHINLLLGVLEFSRTYAGVLISETMLVKSFNDDTGEITKIAAFLRKANPHHSYLTIPHRPPAESGAGIPSQSFQKRALGIFQDAPLEVTLLDEPEGNNFPPGQQFEEELLSLVSVHPLREETLRRLADRSGHCWKEVEKMVEEGKLHKKFYHHMTYYSRY